MAKVRTRCMSCEAPIQFQPGAGSRLCPFCGSVNLVREQLISVPEVELKTDGVFRLLGRGRLEQALEQAERALASIGNHTRLDFYRACTLFELGRSQEAVYLLIDLTGTEAPLRLRADIHAKLAEALLFTDRLDEASKSVTQALELLDGHPTARFIQARILMRRESLVEAIGVLEDTLPQLERRWKITFPPPRCVILLLLARLFIKSNQHHRAFAPLENILIQETAAPLHVVAEAARLLGLNYTTSLDSREEGMALILELMAKSGRRLSELVDGLPRYHIRKIRVECSRGRTFAILRALRAESEGRAHGAGRCTVDTRDGLRLDWADRWVHVRPSNTEPVARIIAEAADERLAGELADEYARKVRELGAEDR